MAKYYSFVKYLAFGFTDFVEVFKKILSADVHNSLVSPSFGVLGVRIVGEFPSYPYSEVYFNRGILTNISTR